MLFTYHYSLITSLLQRIGRNDLDALNIHPLFWPIVGAGLGRRNFFQHIVALNQFAEGGVLAVEKFGRTVADEKLTPGRIGILRTVHRKHATLMRLFVKLGLNFVSGIASAPTCLFAVVLGEGIAALDHKSFDDAVECGPIVETSLGQLLEILDCLWRAVGPELGHHFAFARLDYRYFLFVIHWGRLLFSRGRLFFVLTSQGGAAEGQSDHATKQCDFHS